MYIIKLYLITTLKVSEDCGSNPNIDMDTVEEESERKESEDEGSGRNKLKGEDTKWDEGEEMDQEEYSTGTGNNDAMKNGLEQGIKKGSKEEMESMEGFLETETQEGI